MISKSFELKWLEILNDRCTLDKRMKGQLFRSQLGYQGEADFENIIREYRPKNSRLLHDLTFKKPGRHLQVDFILVSHHGLHLFEIKNFKAQYQLESNQLVNKDGQTFRNIFYQVENGIDFLKKNLDLNIPINGQLVFMSDQDTVDFKGQYEGAYLKRWQLREYFREMENLPKHYINIDKLAHHILSLTSPSHIDIDFYGSEWVSRVRTGIICELCKSSHCERMSRHKLKCSQCGYVEGYKRAIYRTISDYTTLHYTKNVSAKELFEFMNGKVKYRTVAAVYREFLEEKKIGEFKGYENKKFHFHPNKVHS